GSLLLQWVLRAQSVPDVGLAALENRMFVDEVLVDTVRRNDVVRDGIEDREIGLRREHHLNVGEIERAVFECRKHRDTNMRRAESPIRDPAPKDRMHLRHIGAPQYEGIRGLEVVVTS